MFKNHSTWMLPILLMALLTPFSAGLDISIERFFYDGHFSSNAFFTFMYDYGVIPAQVTAFAAGGAFLISYCSTRWRQWRPHALFLLLTMAVGPGFVTHTVLKENWGRPRPKQVIEFGGNQMFRPYYSPNFFHQPAPSKSFPCGHCTMGFYFFAVALIGKRLKNKPLYYLGYLLAFTLGIALSISRMAQGGHFLSDVLFSALLIWLTSLTCYCFIYSRN